MNHRDEALSQALRTARRFKAPFTAHELIHEYKSIYQADIPLTKLDPNARNLEAWLRNEGGSVGIRRKKRGKYFVDEICAEDGHTVRSHVVACVLEKKETVPHSELAALFIKLKKKYVEFGFKNGRALFLSFPELTTNSYGNFKIDNDYVGKKGENSGEEAGDDDEVPLVELAKQLKRSKIARSVAPKVGRKAPKGAMSTSLSVPTRRCARSKETTEPKRHQKAKSRKSVKFDLGEEAAKKSKTAVPARGRPRQTTQDREAPAPKQQRMEPPVVVTFEEVDGPRNKEIKEEYNEEEPLPTPQDPDPFGFPRYDLTPALHGYSYAPPRHSKNELFGMYVTSLLDEADARGEDTDAITRRILSASRGRRG